MKKRNGWMALLGFAAVLGIGAVVVGCAGEQATASEVKIEVTDAGFVPAVANVPKGKPVTLVVTRKVETCATEMIFAGTGEKHDLPLNQTVRIELPADRAETLDYACAMDMIKGKVVSK